MKEWYSAQLRLVAVIEGIGSDLYMDQVHVFLAADWRDAMARALEIGRGEEDEYVNANGHLLAWCFKEILTLDIIGPSIADGAEIHSAFVDVPANEHVSAHATFEPEKSEPRNSI